MKKKLLLGVLLATTVGVFSVSCSSSDDSRKEDEGNGNTTSARYQHKVLIEDATGTWCQYCPRVSYAIQKAKENGTHGDKVVAVAIHQGVSSYPDPMQIPAGVTLDGMFYESYGLKGYPFGLINRTTTWKSPENNNIAQVLNTINEQGSTVGVKISSNLTTTGGTVTASFKFSQEYENLKYTIYVIENGVVTPQSPQRNSTAFYQGQGANFTHNDVLRGVSGIVTGNVLGNVTAGQEVVKGNQSVSFTLFNNDLTKVEVVVFVSDTSGKVLNVQSAHANETVDYVLIN